MIIGSSTPEQISEPIEVEEEHIATSIVVDKDIKIDSFVKYIEGYSWSVNYYTKQLAENDITQPLNLGSAKPIEQFIKYNNLEIKVTSPIENVSINDVEGTAIVTDITVNDGDVFTAKILNGNIGLFRVTNVEHKLYNFKTIYEITYKLDLIKTNTTINNFIDLESKVIKEKYYDNKAIFTGSTPIVDNEVLDYRLNTDKELKRLTRFYFNEFFNRELNTLLVPDDSYKIVDPYLEYFIFKTFDYDDIPFIDRFSRYASSDNELLYNTIYNDIINQEDNLEYLYKGRTLFNKVLHEETSYIKSMRYFGVDYFVSINNNDISSTDNNTDRDIPIFREDIVLSSTIYSKDNLSTLETLILDHISSKTYRVDKILTLVKKYRKWSKIEQFYYLPILYLLMKQSKIYSYSIGDKLWST